MGAAAADRPRSAPCQHFMVRRLANFLNNLQQVPSPFPRVGSRLPSGLIASSSLHWCQSNFLRATPAADVNDAEA